MLSSDSVRNVLDVAPDAMVFIDDTGSIVFTNRQVTALFGYPAAELLGKPVECLLPERFRARHVAHRSGYFGSLRTRPMGIGLELYARRADGSEFPVEISLSPLEEGLRGMVAAAIRDVTERVRTEQQLEELRESAERANQAKSRFLATASHDLRQPLQVLALLNGTLRHHVHENGLEALDQQDQAISAMSRLLNALLDISKLEAGVIKPDIKDFEVAALFRELRGEFAGLAASKGLELIVPPVADRVRSDPALVSQALKNLLANAIKYTRAGTVRMSSQREGDRVRVAVCDSGVGIPAEQLPLIFDEFYQIDVKPNAPREGYGLGLSIVQRVVQLLGLRIHVESEAGRGSTFTLELPASDGPPTALQRSAHLAIAGAPAPAAAPTAHVLLVEDDPGVRKATGMFLRGEGYRVTAAASVSEALQRLADSPGIDLLVTDYHLDQGQTGLQVIAAARSRLGDGVKAILMTGDTSSAVRSLEHDSNLRLASKPMNSDELIDLIHQLLAQPSAPAT